MGPPSSFHPSTFLLMLLSAVWPLLFWPFGSVFAATQDRIVFGPQRFERTTGAPNSYHAAFTVPSYVSGPYQLKIINGNPTVGQKNAIENAGASGRLVIDSVEIVAPKDFSKTTASIEKTFSVGLGVHTLEITLAGSPSSSISVTITGTITLGDMAQARAGHTATLLPDGNVLLLGGRDSTEVLSSGEEFSLLSRQTVGLPVELTAHRSNHTASVLPGSQVLLTGGADAHGPIFSMELYHLRDHTFVASGTSLNPPRAGHTATVLADGAVLLLGGQNGGPLDTAEMFDPQPEVVFRPPYDPERGIFGPLPHNLLTRRWDHTATLLPDGRVLITGGTSADGVLKTAEVFDPLTEEFTAVSDMVMARTGHTATLLPDGQVLILGGRNATGVLATAEKFDPVTNRFLSVEQSLMTARAHHTAVLLPFGEVLVSGGETAPDAILATQEFYGVAASSAAGPTVKDVSPAHTATDVGLTQVVSVRFSEPVDVRTMTAAHMLLRHANAVTVTVTPAEQGLLAILLPSAPLEPGVTYTLSLSGTITDTAGNALTQFMTIFTTTAQPVISSFEPAQGRSGTNVVVYGEHFAPEPQNNLVEFNGVAAHVTAATATSLTVMVPDGATTGPIRVTTAGGTATAATHFVVTGGLSVAITEPTPGASLAADRTLVEGTVRGTEGELGVSVNGVLAFVAGTNWVAEIPLVVGTNTITAVATDAAGTEASVSTRVTVTEAAAPPLVLRAVPESGIAPLVVRWELINQTGLKLVQFEFDETGAGNFGLPSPTFEGVQTLYSTPGLRTPVLRASDEQGATYLGATIINVLDSAQVDAVLQAKWNGMKAALMADNIEGALLFFSPEQRNRYRTLFTALRAQLAQIAGAMQDIQLLTVTENRAKYALDRTELYGGQMETFTYYVYFVQNGAGIWNIEEF